MAAGNGSLLLTEVYLVHLELYALAEKSVLL